MKSAVIFAFILILTIISTPGCKPGNAELVNQAYELNRSGQHNEAIELYTKVIRENDQLQLAYYNRGFAYTALKQYGNALKDFGKVISLQKAGDMFVIFNGESPAAAEAAKMQVPYEDALYQRAQTLFSMDSLGSSFSGFKELVDRNYKHKSNCLMWLGLISAKTSMLAEACAYFRAAKSIAIEEEDLQNAQQLIDMHCPKIFDPK